jgi:hypothetical protein
VTDGWHFNPAPKAVLSSSSVRNIALTLINYHHLWKEED